MKNYKYELNLMEDPNLPFRIGYHKQYIHQFSPPNWHENIEILYIINGTGHIQYDTTNYKITEGDLIVVNSEVIHQLLSDAPIQFHFLTIDRHFCAECGIPSTSLIFQPVIRDPSMKDQFLSILAAYDRYIQTGTFYEVAAIRALLLEFLCDLCKNHLICEKSASAESRNDAVRAAITYIRAHLSEPITVEEIAQYAGVSTFSLARRFKRIMNKTIMDTILLLRCTEAKRLLEKGSSVAEAARTCGFENMSYFTRVFKRYYQSTPSSYLHKQTAPPNE